MKLLKLTMKGYRAWKRMTALDFSEITAATIRGHNGAGKSSIAEAVEWALWGTSRSTTVDGVVSIGAESCTVELEFAVGGVAYRVRRQRATSGAALNVYRLDNTAWTPISGKTIRDTQAVLDGIVGTTRDALLSSAILKQGQHGRFTRASATDRRRILREILAVERWEQIAKDCRSRALAAKRRASDLTDSLNDPRLSGAEERAEEARGMVSDLTAQAEDHDKAAAHFRHQAETARVLGRAAADKSSEARAHLSRRDELERQAAENTKAIGAAQLAIEDANRLADRRARWKADAEARRPELVARLDALHAVQQAWAQASIAQAETRQRVLDLKQQWIDQSRQTTDIEKRWRREIDGHITQAKQQIAGLEASTRAAQKAVAVLDQVPCIGNPLADACPLLKSAFEARAQLAIDNEALKAARGALEAAQAAQEPQALKDARDALEALTRAGKQAAADADALPGFRAVADSTAEGLLDHLSITDASGVTRAIVDTRESIAKLDAMPPELANVPDVEGLRARLEEAWERNKELAKELGALEGWAVQLQDCQALVNRHGAEERLHEGQALAEDAAASECRARAARAEAVIEHCHAALAEIAAKRADIDAAAEEQAHFAACADVAATVPTLLIEAFAIPTLEAEANRVLQAISSSGMSIRLDTQRAKRSGDGQIETLDIVVRDDIGERAYEDFSGGEQFRIDIAFALAQSVLMGSRDEAPVDWLIVDEGWGALDADGVDALKETFAGLQRRYGLLLVITHIDAVAECLPQQIRVIGHHDGSSVEIIR